jgi:hypothetical protein
MRNSGIGRSTLQSAVDGPYGQSLVTASDPQDALFKIEQIFEGRVCNRLGCSRRRKMFSNNFWYGLLIGSGMVFGAFFLVYFVYFVHRIRALFRINLN